METLCVQKQPNDGKKGVPKKAEQSLNYVLNVAEQDFHMSISRNWLSFVFIVWVYTYLYIHIHAYTLYCKLWVYVISRKEINIYFNIGMHNQCYKWSELWDVAILFC